MGRQTLFSNSSELRTRREVGINARGAVDEKVLPGLDNSLSLG